MNIMCLIFKIFFYMIGGGARWSWHYRIFFMADPHIYFIWVLCICIWKLCKQQLQVSHNNIWKKEKSKKILGSVLRKRHFYCIVIMMIKNLNNEKSCSLEWVNQWGCVPPMRLKIFVKYMSMQALTLFYPFF